MRRRPRAWVDPNLTVRIVPDEEMTEAERAEDDYWNGLTAEEERAVVMEMWGRATPCKVLKRMPLRLRWRRWRRTS